LFENYILDLAILEKDFDPNEPWIAFNHL
jgi:hypothetical protein